MQEKGGEKIEGTTVKVNSSLALVARSPFYSKILEWIVRCKTLAVELGLRIIPALLLLDSSSRLGKKRDFDGRRIDFIWCPFVVVLSTGTKCSPAARSREYLLFLRRRTVDAPVRSHLQRDRAPSDLPASCFQVPPVAKTLNMQITPGKTGKLLCESIYRGSRTRLAVPPHSYFPFPSTAKQMTQ